MSYATEGHAGSAFERRTTLAEFQTGLRARSTDSQDWIYVRASGAVPAGVCKVQQSGAVWVVTSAAGTFTNPISFSDGQYGWVRQTYFLPDEADEVQYDDSVTSWGVTTLQGAIEYIFGNFSLNTHTHALDDLSDVTITSLQTGHFLRWNGSAWVNVAITELLALNDLSDVSTTGQASGKILRHNGVSWIVADDNDHTHTLSQITDAGTLAGLNTVGTSQIDNDAVTFAKIQNLGQGTLIGRHSASVGDPEAIAISSGLTLDSGTGALTADVQSVHGRTGAVVAAASDYDASQIDNDSGVSGTFVDDALDWLSANKAALSHTHTASAVTDFSEAVDDRVAALMQNGTGITFTYDDALNTLTAALANMSQSTIKGRAAGAGTGAPQDLTATQATAILDAFVGDSGSGGTKGLVPAPASGDAAAGKFLHADGTFAVPPGTGGISDGDKGDITVSSSGSVWTIDDDTVTNAKAANMAQSTIKGRAAGAGTGDPTDLTSAQATAILDAVVGDSGSGGTKGLVPAPSSGDAAASKFLKADGTWQPVVAKIVQVVNTQTGASATGTTVLPDDDTIPQNSEGDQYMTLAITPGNTNNKLKIDVVVHLGASVVSVVTAALFQDTTANGLAAVSALINANNSPATLVFTHFMTAGTTSSTTFKVRAGMDRAGTTTFNGVSGSRVYGGVSASSITITEIAA